MIQLRLMWWVLWRGALVGAVYGTLIWPVVGTIYIAVVGAILGAVLGLMLVISLALVKGLFFYLPHNPSSFIPSVMILAILLDLVVVLLSGGFIGETVIIAALIVATTQLALILSRRSELSILFRLEN
jgi:hypothetical protein